AVPIAPDANAKQNTTININMCGLWPKRFNVRPIRASMVPVPRAIESTPPTMNTKR
ncbi:MAG: hypothetical protein ACJAUM_001428, partial [Pseudomonadales bacterium]